MWRTDRTVHPQIPNSESTQQSHPCALTREICINNSCDILYSLSHHKFMLLYCSQELPYKPFSKSIIFILLPKLQITNSNKHHSNMPGQKSNNSGASGSGEKSSPMTQEAAQRIQSTQVSRSNSSQGYRVLTCCLQGYWWERHVFRWLCCSCSERRRQKREPVELRQEISRHRCYK